MTRRQVCRAVLSQTDIGIDDEFDEGAMQMYHLCTTREAVAAALLRLVGEPMDADELLARRGSGRDADLDPRRDAALAIPMTARG